MKDLYSLKFIDRKSQSIEEELIYGREAITFFYGSAWLSRTIGRMLMYAISQFFFFSVLYGWLQKTSFSKRKIKPFIKKFGIDSSEFLEPLTSFNSFNDFFIRKLKPEARPITAGAGIAVIPADGRYSIYPELHTVEDIVVKGLSLNLAELIGDKQLAKRYAEGSMVIARLCPTDYHRYHFPIECIPSAPQLINGHLYSVNPLALKHNAKIFMQNKRVISRCKSELFGTFLMIEVGATSVGSICHTYKPHQVNHKGDEKGYFEFGGSSLILIFEPKVIQFEPDLLELSRSGLEIRCLMGQPLGKSVHLH
ncbi:MAG: putative phosphatidylserine decarboxylase proenzyme [Chlamydiales bacterium]|jgi:phosphatidylserine decarboxylase|nr:putative phosphatidylserine decarboxylase proenzyme [Chlamydiales bacterium]